MIVLDTNVISELMRLEPHPVVLNWFAKVGYGTTVVTAVTIMELVYGIERMPKGRQRNQFYARFAALLDGVPVLALQEDAARKAAVFRAMQVGKGLAAAQADMMIAGIVAVNDAVLATRNVRDFSGLPLEIIDPWRVD